nr:MAG TPA: hypothetical protein [Caudoviricetes sp.]DAZ40834.1 MAG TPA: hypothetical protein [Caudoviricetes sp.]
MIIVDCGAELWKFLELKPVLRLQWVGQKEHFL